MGRDVQAALSPGQGFGSRGEPNLYIARSAVEGLVRRQSPSTKLRLVPLPIRFADREENRQA